MHVNLFFDLYFNFLSVKTEINMKNNKRLNWINLEGSDALKRQKHDTWIAMWLNHFEIDVMWTAFKRFLKLYFHILVFWGFSWLSVIFGFSFLDIGLKTKTRKSRKIFILVFFSNFIKFAFVFVFLYFLLAEFVIPLYNCYFRDFRGFPDFRVFDLAVLSVYKMNLEEAATLIWEIFTPL